MMSRRNHDSGELLTELIEMMEKEESEGSDTSNIVSKQNSVHATQQNEVKRTCTVKVNRSRSPVQLTSLSMPVDPN